MPAELDPEHVLSRWMAEALQLHQQGQLQAAQQRYALVLQHRPDHAQALHMLGVAAGQCGQLAQAAQLIGRAAQLLPHDAAVHNNLGTALRQLNRPAEALASHDRAIALDAGFAQARNARGIALQLLLRPQEALHSFEQAIGLLPPYVEAHLNRGLVLLALQRPADALASFDRVIVLAPGLADAHQNRGAALLRLGRSDEALQSFDHALALNPGSADVHLGRADALGRCGRTDDAVRSYDQAAALRPGDATIRFTQGAMLQAAGRPEAALRCYDEAIALDPLDPEPHYNKGTVLQAQRRTREALACYAQAVALRPDHAQARWNMGLSHLLLGELEAGWPGYEWRSRIEGSSSFRNQRQFAQAQWDGSQALAGKTILAFEQQGFGDSIQCARYAGLLAQRGATVLLEVAAPLKSLLETAPGVSRVLVKGEALPPFDFHAPLMSLPYAFRSTLATLPAPVPYLRADPVRLAHWRERLGPRSKPRVGLVWSGNPRHANDGNRSIALARLVPLLAPAIDFVSLQRDLRADDAATLQDLPQLVHFGTGLRDFADTAALIEQLDLVISVDTSVAHLAGALGRPLWLLLPWLPDWRWLLEREDSPWYPSARLFRQAEPGDWDGVLDQVRAALAALAH
jgi:tetratricopeptide (TPR) repeat protein